MNNLVVYVHEVGLIMNMPFKSSFNWSKLCDLFQKVLLTGLKMDELHLSNNKTVTFKFRHRSYKYISHFIFRIVSFMAKSELLYYKVYIYCHMYRWWAYHDVMFKNAFIWNSELLTQNSRHVMCVIQAICVLT